MTKALVIGGYERISDDPNDTRNGVERQTEDTNAAALALGASEVVHYTENNTSAYKRKRVKRTDPLGNDYYAYRVIRPVWQQALADLRAGKIDVLVVWDLDRLARDPRDLEDAIEVVQYYGRKIVGAVPSSIDLSTDGGIAMARVITAMNNKASADTGRRVRRAHEATAKTGKPVGGWRPFGWQADKTTLEATEAALVRSAVSDLLAGRSLRSIVAEWTLAGVTTTAGKPWKQATLRQYLKNPRLIGHRTYRREVLLDAEGNPVKGLWEPLLDTETFDRVQLHFDKPETRGRIPRKDARHYLLTGTIRCGVCSSPMYGNKYATGRHYYVCQGNGHINSISGVGTDQLIEKFVLAKLSDVDLNPDEKPKVWPREGEMEEVKGQIDKLMGAFLDGTLSETVVFPRVKALEESLAQTKKDRAQWLEETTGPALKKLTQDEWDALNTDEQRAHVEKLLDAVLVRPSRKPTGNQYDRWRVVPVPRAG